MDFSSLTFLFAFLPVFLALYFLARPSLRLILVSIASVLFITLGQPIALVWLVGLALAGFAMGRWLESRKKRDLGVRGPLLFGAGAILALLLGFKLLDTYGLGPPLAQLLPRLRGIVAPLGLSYVTFQIVSYIVDVARGMIPAENNLFLFSTYILFFPKLVSGPITRYRQFRDQASSLNPPIDSVARGLRRLLSGVVKRVLVANQLGVVADAVFNLPAPNMHPHFAWIGLIAYALQLYFDFSGYSDVAIGLGGIVGIALPENFNYPYVSQSIGDFWRRWHITLSTWFREYVFYPLERRRLRVAGQQINLVIVFLLVGLWHGPTLTYLAWGLLHGIALAFESAGGEKLLKSLWAPFRHLYATAVIVVGWVFFRSRDMGFALGFIASLVGRGVEPKPLPFSQTTPLPFIEPTFVIVALIAALFSLPVASWWSGLRRRLEGSSPRIFLALQPLEDLALVACFALSIGAQVSGNFRPNIYATF